MYSIIVNINGKPHEKRIPQSWEDVQWIDYVQALQADGEINVIIEALIGIPRRILEAMSPTDYKFVETQCSFFWNDQPVMTALPDDFVKVQIANQSWQKLIDAEQEFKRVSELNLPQIAAAQLIIKTYSGVDIKGMNVPEALSYWDFFLLNSLSGRKDGKTCITRRQMIMKLQQELRSYRCSVGLPRVMRSQRETQPSMMTSLRQKRMSSTQLSYLRKRNQSIRSEKGSMTSLSAKQRIRNHESTNG